MFATEPVKCPVDTPASPSDLDRHGQGLQVNEIYAEGERLMGD